MANKGIGESIREYFTNITTIDKVRILQYLFLFSMVGVAIFGAKHNSESKAATENKLILYSALLNSGCSSVVFRTENEIAYNRLYEEIHMLKDYDLGDPNQTVFGYEETFSITDVYRERVLDVNADAENHTLAVTDSRPSDACNMTKLLNTLGNVSHTHTPAPEYSSNSSELEFTDTQGNVVEVNLGEDISYVVEGAPIGAIINQLNGE